MKTTIKTLTIALLIGLLSLNNISAQPPKGHQTPPVPNEEQIDKMVEEMGKALALTENQKKEIEAMYTEHFNEVKALMEKHKQEKEEAKKDHDSLRNEFENQVKAILNDDQKNAYDEFLETHKPKSKPQRK